MYLFLLLRSFFIPFSLSYAHTSVIFKMQKRVIKTIIRHGYGETWRELFKELKILPLSSQYIFYLLLFIVNNRDYFVLNNVCHNNNTTQTNNLHLFEITGHVSDMFKCLPKAIKNISTILILNSKDRGFHTVVLE
jgi:hypothetical protein